MTNLSRHLRCTIRHGSSVPGPLEARRRSSKRRMGGAATGADYNVEKDTGILLSLGFGLQDRSKGHLEKQVVWQPPALWPGAQKSRPWVGNNSDLPSWLSEMHNSENNTQHLKLSPPVAEKFETLRQPQSLSTSTLVDWNECLRKSNSLAEIRTAATKQGFSLEWPELSRQAFQRLRELDLPLSLYLDFMADHMLSPPSAQNTIEFLRLIARRSDTGVLRGKSRNRAVTRAQKWIDKETRLGNLEEAEIRAIIHASLRSKKAGTDSDDIHRMFPDIYNVIWAGIASSPVRSTKDISSTTIRVLLQAAAQDYDVKRGLTIAKEILLSLHSQDRQRAATCLRSFICSFLDNPVGTALPRFWNKKNVGRADVLYEFLEPLPADIMANAVVSLLSRVLHNADHWKRPLHELQVEKLQSWIGVLGRPELITKIQQTTLLAKTWSVIERKLAESDPTILAIYFERKDASDASTFLLDYWFMPRIATFMVRAKPAGDTMSLADFRNRCIQEQSRAVLDGKTCPYVRLVRNIHHMAPAVLLPYVPKLLTLLQNLSDPASLLLVVKEMQRRRIHIPLPNLYHVINHLAYRQPISAISLFLQDPRTRIEECQPLATAIMASNSVNNEVLLRLISRRSKFNNIVPHDRDSETNSFIYDLASRLFLSTSASPKHSFKHFKRIFFSSEKTDGEGLIDHDPTLLAPVLVHACLSSWLRSGQTVPTEIKKWVFPKLEELKGREISEEVYGAVKERESEILRDGGRVEAAGRLAISWPEAAERDP